MKLIQLILCVLLRNAFKSISAYEAVEHRNLDDITLNDSIIDHIPKNFDVKFIELTRKSSLGSIYIQRAAQIFNKEYIQDNVMISDRTSIPNQEGAFCRRSFDGRSGYCILAYQCLHVMREHRVHGIKIDICTYRKNIPVICCSLEDKHVVEQRISAEKCQEYHGALRSIQLSVPRELSGRQCISSIPMIVGGERTQAGAYPHMAALGWTESDSSIKWGCGGSLISEQFVLTAAHCATTNSKPPDVVRLGVEQLNNTSRSKQDVKILIIILHPKYSSSAYYNDIALLKLTKRVRISDHIRPACLWPHANIPPGTTLQATGWGRTKFLGPQSNDLLKVDLDLLDQELCKNVYQTERRLSRGIVDSQFCAGHMDGRKDTCAGDSGGPIHIELPEYNCVKFVVGITSFGKFCAAPNSPGVYTKIYTYLDWIEKVVFRS